MIKFTILGQPYSKANSRKVVKIGGRSALIKSDPALEFERNALRQIPPEARQRLTGPVSVTLRLFYSSQRPDLDESLLLDVLQNRYASVGNGPARRRVLVQDGVYINDRQVREKHVFHGIDKSNPRAEVTVELMVPR